MEVLFEDKNLIVVIKPAGVESQSSGDFSDDMVSLIKKHLAAGAQSRAGGAQGGKAIAEPYVGVVHRLDRNVAGVMVYALDKSTAAALSKDVANNLMNKTYEAILQGIPKDKKGELVDFLIQDNKANITRIATAQEIKAKDSKVKEAKLKYKVIENKFVSGKQLSKVEIELITGRHHQIRVQFASRKTPIVGDLKYGYEGEVRELMLAATSLEFVHPKTKKTMRYKYDWNRHIS